MSCTFPKPPRPSIRSRTPLLVACLVLACGEATEPVALPTTIHSCETGTAIVCVDWVLGAGGRYSAQWPQGSRSVITPTAFTTGRVEFEREDTSGPTAGMHAVYSGRPAGNAVEGGEVAWITGSQIVLGTWTANW